MSSIAQVSVAGRILGSVSHREDLIGFYSGEVRARQARVVGPERDQRLAAFLDECTTAGLTRVLEVGSGVGRDGTRLASRLDYAGVDLTPAFVEHCCSLGLDVREASADALPFADANFDAAWTMSTLMHLVDEEFTAAIAELGRVVRPGGLIEAGMWGNHVTRDHTGRDGRFFRHRSDGDVRAQFERIGAVLDFDTWDEIEDFGYYQWLRVRRDPSG